jgi:hypothetical protein
MRLMAVRRSVTARPLRLSEAELEIRSSRAASAGSDPTTRTTCSTEDFGSDKTRLTRTRSRETRADPRCRRQLRRQVRTKSNATSDWACNAVFVKFALTVNDAGNAKAVPPRESTDAHT